MTTLPVDEENDADDWNMSSGGFLDYGDEYDLFYECDPLQQSCPADEKCVPISDSEGEFSGAQCVLVIGDIPAGEPCTKADPSVGVDDCDATSMCWFVEGETGVCTPMCSGYADNPTCPDMLSCFHASPSPALWVCVPACNPLLQDCPAGQACHWEGNDFGCSPSNDIPPSEPCALLPFDCAAGSICIVAEVLDGCDAESCCTAYCDIEDPEACAAFPGTACVSFWQDAESPTPALANVGVCLPA